MKKTLLSIAAVCMLVFSANAQSFSDGDTGFLLDYSGASATPNCLTTFANTGANFSSAGGNLVNTGMVGTGTNQSLQFAGDANATTAGVGGVSPYFYDITTSQSGSCLAMRTDDVGIDMSATANAKASITAKSDIDGTILRIYLGSSVAQAYPYSTFNNNSAGPVNYIIWEIALTTSYATYSFDFTANPADATEWSEWQGSNPAGSTSGANHINMVGFTVGTSNAVINVQNIEFGSVVTGTSKAILPSSVKFGPSPSSDVINVDLSSLSTDAADIKLLNFNGAVVKEETNGSSISVKGLNSGLYFLQINNFTPVKVVVE